MRFPARPHDGIAPAAVAVLLGTAVAAIASFLVRLLMARALDPDDLGRVVLAVATASAAGGVAGLGLTVSAADRISSLRARGEASAVPRAGRTALVLASAAGVIAAIAVALVGLGPWNGGREALWWVLAPVAPGLALGLAMVGISRGHGDVLGRALRDGGGGLLRLLAVAIVAVGGGDALAFAAAFAVGSVVAEGSFAIWGVGRRWCAAEGWDRDLVRRTPAFVGLTLVQQGSQWMDVLILGLVAPPSVVGLYSVARGTGRVLEMAADAAAHRFLPDASAAVASADPSRVADLHARNRRLAFALTAPALAPALVAPAALLGAAFGDEYTGAAPALRILAAALLVATLVGYTDKLLIAAERPLAATRARLAGTLAGAVVLFALAPSAGGLLAAAAGWATLTLVARAGEVVALRQAGFLQAWDRRLLVRFAIVAAGVAAGIAVARVVPLPGWGEPLLVSLGAGAGAIPLLLEA